MKITIVRCTTIIISIVVMATAAYNQVQDSLWHLQQVAVAYTNKLDHYSSLLNEKIDQGIQKHIHALYRAENTLASCIQQQADSTINKAYKSYEQLASDYEDYMNHIQQKAKSFMSGKNLNTYIPSLDTLTTSLTFLDAKNFTDKLPYKQALEKLNTLQQKFQYAHAIEQVLKDKQQAYKDLLSKYTDIPNRLKRKLQRYSEKVYYYKQQINEYQEALHDMDKMQATVLGLLNKLPAFQEFMRKNSFFSSIFRLDNPTDINDPSLAGLQRRVEVNAQIQSQISNGGPNATAMVQQHIQEAKQELNKLKDRLLQQNNTVDIDMPNFKPNTQKTKTFWKRLEYGTNIQTQKGSSILPNSSDIGLSVGYKLNDRSIIGIGTAYKLGLGTGLDHIRFTSEGISLRSYIDYKIKGSWYMSGGYEQNYLSRFSSVQELQNKNAWQESGLLGVSKVQKLGKKYKAKIQLLYDFLYWEQTIKTSPLKFRIGYVF